MGRSISYPYRLEFRCQEAGQNRNQATCGVRSAYFTPQVWRVKRHFGCPGEGKPNNDNLRKWVVGFERSTVDGANEHIGPHFVTYAKIVRQCDDVVMAEYKL